MDSLRFQSDYDLSVFYRYIKNKIYRIDSFDCCIVGGDAALRFLLKRQDLFGHTPIVYFNVFDEELAKEADQYSNITGVRVGYDYDSNLELAKQLIHNIEKFYFVVDDSEKGRIDKANIEDLGKRHEEYEFEILNMSEMSRDDFYRIIESTKAGEAIFLQDLYLEADNTVNDYTNVAINIA